MRGFLPACLVLASFSTAQGVWTWIPLNSFGLAISGNRVIGQCPTSDGGLESFVVGYDGMGWTALNYPGENSTWAHGIDGNRIVGNTGSHGFVFDGANWTSLQYPGAIHTTAQAVSGSNIVGHYWYASGTQYHREFLYDGSGYVTLTFPQAWRNVYVEGISGTTIIGGYDGADGVTHAFIYDGLNSRALNYPGSLETIAMGIDGNNIVGGYRGIDGHMHGFIYNGTAWTSFDRSGATDLCFYGISGNNLLAGDYVLILPEPGAALLLLGGMLVCLRRPREPAR